MGLLDILPNPLDLITGGKKGAGGSIFDSITSMIGLGGNKNPEAMATANETKESAESERGNLFSEVGKSMLLRQFPRFAGLLDLGKFATGNKSPEVVPWQNEFETITAFLLLVPNKWKHFLTDFIAGSSIFQTLINYWPGMDGVDLPLIGKSGPLAGDLPILGKGGSIRERVKQGDPDAVIQALRIIHQDVFVTGKVSLDKLKELTGGTGSALAILGGGAGLLTAGSALIGGGSETPSGVTETISGSGEKVIKGKKIVDLVRENPQEAQTTMQKNLIALLTQMGVLDSAELIRGGWKGNNDEVTVSYSFQGGKYYLVFDNDIQGTDLTLKTSDGRQIFDERDDWTFNPDESSADLIKAMNASPSPEEKNTPKDDKKSAENKDQKSGNSSDSKSTDSKDTDSRAKKGSL